VGDKDDPYTPYWPGDEWVDWIGMSLFHFGVGGRREALLGACACACAC
jgi:hypothetical protein